MARKSTMARCETKFHIVETLSGQAHHYFTTEPWPKNDLPQQSHAWKKIAIVSKNTREGKRPRRNGLGALIQ